MMNYCFWYGESKPSDLEWLGTAIRLLKENEWDGQTTLYFDGRSWGERLREEAAISLLQALQTNSSVKSLYLRQADLDVKAETALHQVFENNKHLERIVLRNIETTAGILPIPEGLFQNPSLKELEVTKGFLGSASLAALSASLLSNSMNHLSLDNVVLDGCLNAFANGIEKSESLRHFSLKNMRLSQTETGLLLEAIGKNQSIRSLSLENLNLGTPQIDLIVTMFTTNCHLEKVSLRRNIIDGDAAASLFRDVSTFNPSLRSLLLSGNPLGDEGARAITTFLKCNTSLETLCLVDCRLGKVGCRTIAEGLKAMQGIRQLYLDSNEIKSSASPILDNLQNGNYSLTEISQRSLTSTNTRQKDDDSKQTAIWLQIEMYLRWNKLGRKVLRGQRLDLLLSYVLNRVNSDPDLIFSFLKESSAIISR
ncbi:hypothetical protein FisN_12Lh119 [Fistulifera solaris]|uniref:Uncharacterized protein n=1 Tax=Fistulifera solaris TaxID=1519565 RepID=A0A1Z5JMH8_FISSO|nr:hypothetical protein FisN_12Lh119 [Fistulifera solaris]|eukprot:GAX15179.1 hypothetical protein FisN_12Lh119 [Fistulifera solaris]